MKIGAKFAFMVGIPIIAIAVILVIGTISFTQTRTLIGDLVVLEGERATMIDADRDAYQAFLAERNAVQAGTREEVEAEKASSIENLDQTWSRIMGPAEHFTDEFSADLEAFQTEFSAWRSGSEEVIQLALDTVDGNLARDAALVAAIDAFDEMRNVIDELGVMIDEELSSSISLSRRRDLEGALSLVLNADRDVYQAFVAQILIIDATDEAGLLQQEADNTENAQQTYDRVTQGADIVGGDALALKRQFAEYYNDWNKHNLEVVSRSKANFSKNATIVVRSAENEVHFQTMRDAINALGELQSARVENEVSALDTRIARIILIYLLVAGISVLITVVIVSITAIRLLRSIKKCANFSDGIARGDFNIELDVRQKDEIGDLADSMRAMLESVQYKADIVERIASGDLTMEVELASEVDGLGHSLVKMIDSLNKLLGEVSQAIDQVNSGSNQVSQAGQDLSQGATEQASSLEEISSSLTQINSQSKRNAESADEANAIAHQAATDAAQGNSRMAELQTAMERINASSDEIGKVVKVIDDIAFQINLLALNANVEAARAGKYGKGFAVVAEEVRNLATRSADAVKDTSTRVEETVRSIADGTTAAAGTAEQLSSIVSGANKVAELLSEIALASKEQAQGVEQINEGLARIDQVTQSNTASAEESASASEELAGQAVQLQTMIQRFNLKSSSLGYSHSHENEEVSKNGVVERKERKPIADARSKNRPAKESEQTDTAEKQKTPTRPVNPKEVIELDDEDFGEF